jgi:hypothetical protein
MPVAIKGLEQLSFGNFFSRHVKIAFLDPIFPIDVAGLREEEIAREVRLKVAECYIGL